MSQTRTVVVTGGIEDGLATAKRFAELGHQSQLLQDPGHIDDAILAVACDQTSSDAVDAAEEIRVDLKDG